VLDKPIYRLLTAQAEDDPAWRGRRPATTSRAARRVVTCRPAVLAWPCGKPLAPDRLNVNTSGQATTAGGGVLLYATTSGWLYWNSDARAVRRRWNSV
jgi:hypothetical protein